MADFRIDLLNGSGRVVQQSTASCADDGQACAPARRQLSFGERAGGVDRGQVRRAGFGSVSRRGRNARPALGRSPGRSDMRSAHQCAPLRSSKCSAE